MHPLLHFFYKYVYNNTFFFFLLNYNTFYLHARIKMFPGFAHGMLQSPNQQN